MLMNFMNEDSPCKDCPERFPACSANCPKDKRGEYGYDAWTADMRKKKAQYNEYVKRHNEDYRRSEEFDWKNRKRGYNR